MDNQVKATFVIGAERQEIKAADLVADQRAIEALLLSRGWTKARVRGLGKFRPGSK